MYTYLHLYTHIYNFLYVLSSITQYCCISVLYGYRKQLVKDTRSKSHRSETFNLFTAT